MLLKGRVKAQEDKLGLVKIILEKNGIKAEEDKDTIYFEEEVNSFTFNRGKACEILEQIKELQVEEAEIGAYSVVEIYHYKIGEEGEKHD